MYSPNLNNRLYVQVVASMDNYHHRVSYSFAVVLILVLGVRFRSRQMTVHVYWSDGAFRKSEDHSHHQVGMLGKGKGQRRLDYVSYYR